MTQSIRHVLAYRPVVVHENTKRLRVVVNWTKFAFSFVVQFYCAIYSIKVRSIVYITTKTQKVQYRLVLWMMHIGLLLYVSARANAQPTLLYLILYLFYIFLKIPYITICFCFLFVL
jgi:hypothetical protein